MRTTQWWLLRTAVIGLSVLLSACSAVPTGAVARARPLSRATAPAVRIDAAPLVMALTPAPDAIDLPVSVEVGTTVQGGAIAAVDLVDAAGHAVAGAMRDDGSAWVPAQPLAYETAYTATVTATGPGDQHATGLTRFTTMRRPTGERVGTGLYLFSGSTYGVAMPVVVEFESDVAVSDRAAVEHRLFVHSEPSQPGAWRWFGSRQLMYRPPVYWQPGTRLTVRAALGGYPIGARFGDQDRSATVTIGRDLRIDVDNATKQMTVTEAGQVVKTAAVSLGKPSTPSSSGTMVIMEKAAKTVFDTTAEDGPKGYRIDIEDAQRLTWGGQFIHSAPWSVDDQGVRNVSHGCVNVSPGNASWLFDRTLVGDPVTVRGTDRVLNPGDGWTAWNIPWSEFAPGVSIPSHMSGPARAGTN